MTRPQEIMLTAQRMAKLYGVEQAIERANEHGLANSMGKCPADETFWLAVIHELKHMAREGQQRQ